MGAATAPERLAIVFQTEARLEGAQQTQAAIAATKAQTTQLGQATQVATNQIAQGATRGTGAMTALAPRIRSATNAVAILSQAAATGTGSIVGMANAAGNLATQLAFVARSARVAAAATGIGAVIALGTVAYGVFTHFRDRAREGAERIRDLTREVQGLNAQLAGDETGAKRLAILRATETEIARIKAGNLARADKNRLIDLENTKRTRSLQLLDQEAARESRIRADRAANALFQARNEVGGLAGQLTSDVEARRRQIVAQEHEELRALETRRLELKAAEEIAAFDRDRPALIQAINDKRYYGLRLLYEEQAIAIAAARTEAMALSGSPFARSEAKLREIEMERQAAIKATGDRLSADEVAEAKKRKLYRDTARAAAQDAKTITDVLLASKSKEVKAFGLIADTIRRVIIGAQAAHAAVEAAIEGGKAIGSLAAGDFRGAALHGAAALELAKAAALGAQESLGGGRSAGAGGAAGGPTFQPRDSGGGGSQTLILQTVDPFSREVIAQTAYHLERGRVLHRPIYVPPTFGFGLQGAA